MKFHMEITTHEMLVRWAVGELDSGFFPVQLFDRGIVGELLRSPIPEKQDQGLMALRFTRAPILARFPSDTRWHLAELAFTPSDFAPLLAIHPEENWNRLTGGSYRLLDACVRLHVGAAADGRIPRMVQRFEELGDEAHEERGITFVARSEDGPYTVVEGHGRLVARYIASELRQTRRSRPVMVAVGLSQGMLD